MNPSHEALVLQYLKDILISLKKIEQYTVPYHVQVEEARRLIDRARTEGGS